MNKITIGIDPGASGAIAACLDGGEIKIWQLKKDRFEDVLRELSKSGNQIYALLEKVGATPQMGVCSSFVFGENYGGIKSALRALNIPFELIMPKKWQQIYPLPKCKPNATPEEKKAFKLQHKRDLYNCAKDLFPTLCTSQDKADALLILNYAMKRKYFNF